MIKESVLEIEFQPIFDKWGWRIIKQNEDILKRNKFEDKNIGVYSVYFPQYSYSECILNIRGNVEEKDNLINICTDVEKREIEVKVRNINEKYGIIKRWRASEEDYYYYITDTLDIKSSKDFYSVYSNERYKLGNYFKTEVEAEEYLNYIKKCLINWHRKRCED